MNIDLDTKQLSQAKVLEYMQRDLQAPDMITVYLDTEGNHNYSIYCALIPSNQIEQALSSPSWDFLLDNGTPSAVEYLRDGNEYLRYGDDNGPEPLVINRGFNESISHGRREDYREISEEFRLFHNLYHNRETDEYIKIDDKGNEYLVAVIKPNCIKIRLKEIRQFLAVKKMYLSVQFEFWIDLNHLSEEPLLAEDSINLQDGFMCWTLFDNVHRAARSLTGKRLIKPL